MAAQISPATIVAGNGKPVDPVRQVSQNVDDATLCKEIVYTGTRFSSKECHTRGEWKQMAVDAANYQKYVDMRADEMCAYACGVH